MTFGVARATVVGGAVTVGSAVVGGAADWPGWWIFVSVALGTVAMLAWAWLVEDRRYPPPYVVDADRVRAKMEDAARLHRAFHDTFPGWLTLDVLPDSLIARDSAGQRWQIPFSTPAGQVVFGQPAPVALTDCPAEPPTTKEST